jgi:hypothetical protein
MSEKPKINIDQNNNLSIEKKGQQLKPRGRFSIDKDDRLIYWLNAPLAWQRKYRLGSIFVFEGKWRLNANHDLELELEKSKAWEKNAVLVFKGDIVSPDKDKLVFQIKSKDSQRQSQIYFLELRGNWQADKYNRINFSVKKTKEPEDVLVLNGSWQVNQNQQILYTYEKTNLKTKTKTTQRLVFNGYWQINEAQRLSYIFSSGQQSRFDFRCQIESPNLYPAEGVIKYRLGAGLRESGKSPAPRIVYLYGKWKFSRKFALNFQMDYGRGRVEKILFGTQIRINKKNEITVSLTNSRSEALGMRLIFTRRFLKKLDAQAFLRLERGTKEAAVKAGVRIPF